MGEGDGRESWSRLVVPGVVAAVAGALATAVFTGVVPALQSQPAPSGTSSAGPSATAAVVPSESSPAASRAAVVTSAAGVPGPPVRNATAAASPVVLVLGRGLDLDSTAADWGQQELTFAQDRLDVTYDGTALAFARRATAFPTPPTPDDCAAATSFTDGALMLSAPDQAYFCVTTSEGRFSAVAVHVADLDTLVLRITTWQRTGA